MIDKPLPPPKYSQHPFSSPAQISTHRSSISRTVNSAGLQACTSLQANLNHHHRRNSIRVTYHFSNSEPESRCVCQHWSESERGGEKHYFELTCMPNTFSWRSSLRGTNMRTRAEIRCGGRVQALGMQLQRQSRTAGRRDPRAITSLWKPNGSRSIYVFRIGSPLIRVMAVL